MDVDQKLRIAMDMCNGKLNHKYNLIYPFTNENIAAYLSLFDLENKSLFTVGSSSDQVLNAIFAGCYDITLFDICPFIKEYYYLKKTLIELLDREEYLKFLCYKNYPKTFFSNKKAFDDKIYNSIKDSIKEDDFESYYFWSELFNKYGGLYVRIALFSRDEYKYNIVSVINNYLKNDDNFNVLKCKMRDINVKFINGDIFKYNIPFIYDNIFLSNLGTCYSFEEFIALVNKMVNVLNYDGRMLISYLYDTDDNNNYMEGEAKIYDLVNSLKKFPVGSYVYSFIGHHGLLFKDSKMKDSIITYKKLKKI